jgi:hypothetical protein
VIRPERNDNSPRTAGEYQGAKKREFGFHGKILVGLAMAMLCGCSTIKRAFTRQAAISVVGTSPLTGKPAPIKVSNPDNAGEPATLHSNEALTEISVDKGTKMTLPIVVNGTETTATLELPPLKLSKRELVTSASASAPDKSIAIHQINVAAKQPLLWGAIACTLLGIYFAFKRFPTAAISCGVGAVALFLAWQIASLPPWFWLIGVAAPMAAIGIFIGYQRHERDAKEEAVKPVNPPPPPVA